MNKAFINRNGIIEAVFQGNQSATNIRQISQQGKQLAAKLRAQKKSVFVLVDIEQLGAIDNEARQVAATNLQRLDFDRAAIYGSSSFVKQVLNLIIKAVGDKEKVKTFNERSAAKDWLKNADLAPQLPPSKSSKNINTLKEYREYVKSKLAQLQSILSLAAIGEFTKAIAVPEEDDEFLDVFVGIQLLMDTLEEKMSLAYHTSTAPLAKSAQESPAEGVIITDKQGSIILMNQAARSGIASRLVSKTNNLTITNLSGKTLAVGGQAANWKDGVAHPLEEVCYLKDGRKKVGPPFRAIVGTLNQEGNPVGHVLVLNLS